MTRSKTRYSEFCQTVYVPLHFQPWWLDAVCSPNAWEAAIAPDWQGLPTGVMPYFKTRYWGIPVVRQSPFTAYAGPWFQPGFLNNLPEYKRMGWQHRVLDALIGQLPRVIFYQQNFRPEIRNWLPFYWAGFRQTTRYTYLLPDPIALPDLYAGLKNTVRTDLRRAGEVLEIAECYDLKLLFELNKKSFERKGLRQPYTFPVFQRLHIALAERGKSLSWLAIDRRYGNPCAGLYLTFDDQEAAVLLTGLDPDFGNSGALNALYWQAIQFCSERRLRLDFEGSMQPGIERVFRSFGGQLTPYFQVSRLLASGSVNIH